MTLASSSAAFLPGPPPPRGLAEGGDDATDPAAATEAAVAELLVAGLLGKSIWRTMDRFFFIFLRLRLFSLFTLALLSTRSPPPPFLEATGDTSAAAAAAFPEVWPRRLLTGSWCSGDSRKTDFTS